MTTESTSLKVGDKVRVTVRKVAVFGVFCEFGTQVILVLIPEISWIASFCSCEQFAVVGDLLEIQIIGIADEKIVGTHKLLFPENNPFGDSWHLNAGDVIDATIIRWVESADRCGDIGAYLVALRPGAYTMLCGVENGRYRKGDVCPVEIASINAHRGSVVLKAASR